MTPRVMIPVKYRDLLNEIFDMATEVKHERITLKDLLQCGVGGNVVNLLIDAHAFMQYQLKE